MAEAPNPGTVAPAPRPDAPRPVDLGAYRETGRVEPVAQPQAKEGNQFARILNKIRLHREKKAGAIMEKVAQIPQRPKDATDLAFEEAARELEQMDAEPRTERSDQASEPQAGPQVEQAAQIGATDTTEGSQATVVEPAPPTTVEEPAAENAPARESATPGPEPEAPLDKRTEVKRLRTEIKKLLDAAEKKRKSDGISDLVSKSQRDTTKMFDVNAARQNPLVQKVLTGNPEHFPTFDYEIHNAQAALASLAEQSALSVRWMEEPDLRLDVKDPRYLQENVMQLHRLGEGVVQGWQALKAGRETPEGKAALVAALRANLGESNRLFTDEQVLNTAEGRLQGAYEKLTRLVDNKLPEGTQTLSDLKKTLIDSKPPEVSPTNDTAQSSEPAPSSPTERAGSSEQGDKPESLAKDTLFIKLQRESQMRIDETLRHVGEKWTDEQKALYTAAETEMAKVRFLEAEPTEMIRYAENDPELADFIIEYARRDPSKVPDAIRTFTQSRSVGNGSDSGAEGGTPVAGASSGDATSGAEASATATAEGLAASERTDTSPAVSASPAGEPKDKPAPPAAEAAPAGDPSKDEAAKPADTSKTTPETAPNQNELTQLRQLVEEQKKMIQELSTQLKERDAKDEQRDKLIGALIAHADETTESKKREILNAIMEILKYGALSIVADAVKNPGESLTKMGQQ
jgi:hypothetical protein